MRDFGRGDRGDRGDRRGGFGGGGGYGGGGRGFGGGRGGGGGGGDFEKPVKEGQEYDITIESVGSRGDGVGKVNNFVVFVAGAQQGEKLKIRITKVFNRFAVGERSGAAGESSSTQDAAEESGDEESSDEQEEEQ